MENCKYLFSITCRSINIKVHQCCLNNRVKYRYSFDCPLGDTDWEDVTYYDTVGTALDAAVVKAEGSWDNAVAYWEQDPDIVKD